MKADYQSLMDELPESSYIVTNKGLSREVQYIEYEIDAQNLNGAGRNIASLSMEIQKGKYDGTAAAIEKLTMEEKINNSRPQHRKSANRKTTGITIDSSGLFVNGE